MPIEFTDEVLLERGEWEFRPKEPNETLEDYRNAYAHHFHKTDPVQAREILIGTPWDKWTPEQAATWLLDNCWIDEDPYSPAYLSYQDLKVEHGHLVKQIMIKRNREAGVIGQDFMDQLTHKLNEEPFERKEGGPPPGLKEAMDYWAGQGNCKVTRLGPDGKPERSLKREK